jgi:hypothetical protein
MNDKLKGYLLNPFVLFLAAWGILNLFQARFTPLDNDEAYYWMYSKYLAWGYFDHPPMIALMIRIGYYFFHNELGLRLIVVLSQLIALFVIWRVTDKEQRSENGSVLFFFMLIVIMPVFNIFGFMATPDAPLILFTAVFLLAYKHFLAEESWSNTFFLSFSMAALMYSKYHSGLLIILVILSNPALLKRIRFYLASFLAFLLFSPHLFWQYSNGFPSLKYHLVDRVSAFNPSHVPDYLVGQYFFHNPLIFTILIWIMIKMRPRNLFDRSLYFIITGFFAFFFISSFRYRVEPQWTALVSVPMIIILFSNPDFKPWLRKYVKWVAVFIFPLLLFVRLASAWDFLPSTILKKEFHNKKQWVKDIDNLAENKPVVFTNSYQRAAVYTFYTGNFAYTLDNLNYRKTQYDLWNFEEQLHGKDVLYVPHYFSDYYKTHLTRQILTNGDSIFTKVFKDFQSLQRECVILENKEYTFNTAGISIIHLKIFNPYPYAIDFKHKELPILFQLAFLRKGSMETRVLELPESLGILNAHDTIQADCHFTAANLTTGLYKIGICSRTGILYDTFSSNFREARISGKN